jgi:Tat protein translocase TatC
VNPRPAGLPPELLVGASIIIGLAVLTMLLLVFNYGQLWFQAYWSKARVTFMDLLGMSLRKVNARTIVQARIMATQAGLGPDITPQRLEAHYLAGGDVPRLIKALIGFFVMFILSFAFSKQIFQILLGPYAWAAGGADKVSAIYTHPLESLFTQIKIGVFGGLFLSFPVIATQIYKFVAPGLYKNEREAFLPYLIATPVFFLLGTFVVYFIAMPLLMQFALAQQVLPGTDGQAPIRLDAKISEYLDLIMQLIFAFGIT